MLNAEVALQLDDEVVPVRVKNRALVSEGKIVGRYGANPILNCMIYEVELLGGQVKNYAANVVTENIISQIDYKEYSATLVNSNVDYKIDDSEVDTEDKYIVTRIGKHGLRKTS